MVVTATSSAQATATSSSLGANLALSIGRTILRYGSAWAQGKAADMSNRSSRGGDLLDNVLSDIGAPTKLQLAQSVLGLGNSADPPAAVVVPPMWFRDP